MVDGEEPGVDSSEYFTGIRSGLYSRGKCLQFFMSVYIDMHEHSCLSCQQDFFKKL